MKILPIIALLSIIANVCQANVTITEATYNDHFTLDENLFYYEDPTGKLTFEEATSDGFFKNYTQLPKSIITLGTTKNDIWLLFKVTNSSKRSHSSFLSLRNPMIDEIVFFTSYDSSFYNTGLKYPFKQRMDESKDYNFVITANASQTVTFCIKLSAQDNIVTVPILLTPGKQYFGDGKTRQAMNGLVYAIAILTILMLLMLYISEKDKLYISSMLLMTCIFALLLWYDLTIYKFIVPNSPNGNIKIGALLIPLTLTAFAYYIRACMPPKPQKGKLNISSIAIISGLAITVLSFMSLNYLFRMVLRMTYTAIIVGYFVYCAITTNDKKSIHYRLNFVVSGTILVTLIYKSLINSEYGMLVYTNEHYVKIALLTLSALSFFKFGHKFITSRAEYYELSQNMDKAISKRTQLINQQKEELSSQREELIQQKDALQAQREELRAQKELLQIKNEDLSKISQVTNLSNNTIAIFNTKGELDWFNDAFGKAYNIELENYKNSDTVNIIDICANKNLKHVLSTCIREKEVISYESEITTPTGNSKWVQTTLTPIQENDEVKLIIAVDTDITQLKLYESKIEQQKAEAEKQRNLAIVQKEELESKQNELYGSIRYAKRIQTAMMPKAKQLLRDFNDSFVLFLPKDIVSGDFYWYHRIDNKYFIACVDCTGHGVPGAFLSIIGSSLLNSIVIHNGVHKPSEILKHLNRKIKISLKSDTNDQNDGMDIAIVVIDKDTHQLEYAGALRPLYLYCNNEFIEVKGDKIPVTSNIIGTSFNNNYTNYEHPFNPGDQFYIFSDGIIDQFGGEEGKKFLTKRFKELLEDIKTLPMKEQKDRIKKAHDEWRGNKFEQIDDILVIGVRYTAEDL